MHSSKEQLVSAAPARRSAHVRDIFNCELLGSALLMDARNACYGEQRARKEWSYPKPTHRYNRKGPNSAAWSQSCCPGAGLHD